VHRCTPKGYFRVFFASLKNKNKLVSENQSSYDLDKIYKPYLQRLDDIFENLIQDYNKFSDENWKLDKKEVTDFLKIRIGNLLNIICEHKLHK